MPSFLDCLHSGGVVLMDGAMGTELQRAGIRQGECYELWNLTHPEQVRAIHQAYADAGAECLLANTFQANPAALARHGLEDQMGRILQAAVALARGVAGPERFVLVGVGPVDRPPPLTYWQILNDLQGADAVLLETWSDPEAAGECLRVARGRLPVLVSFTFWRGPPDHELRTFTDHRPEACARIADRGGAIALGVNCGRDLGMGDVAEVLRRYRSVTRLPLFARPNAGTPTRTADGWVYPQTPQRMAARLPELLDAGAMMVGGCCGTTPEHIATFRQVLTGRARAEGTHLCKRDKLP
jgi:5-methyltetrahydrofolate--homocysteine methyltransferase